MRSHFFLIWLIFVPLLLSECNRADTSEGSNSGAKHNEKQGRISHSPTVRPNASKSKGALVSNEWYQSENRVDVLQNASFPEAMQLGRSLIDSGNIPDAELMSFFMAVPDVSKSYKLCLELVESVAKTDIHRALKIAAMANPGLAPPRLYAQIVECAHAADLLDVMMAAHENGLDEVDRETKSAIESKLLSISEEDFILFKADPRASEFKNVLESREAALAYEKNGLKIEDFTVKDKSIEFKKTLINVGINARPAQTAQWISANFETLKGSEILDEQIVSSTSRAYLAKSPNEAMAWAASIGQHDLSGVAVRAGVDSWLQIDSVAAGEWVSKQPGGYARDVAALAVAQHLQKMGDMNSARQWANSVKEEELKMAAQQLTGQK